MHGFCTIFGEIPHKNSCCQIPHSNWQLFVLRVFFTSKRAYNKTLSEYITFNDTYNENHQKTVSVWDSFPEKLLSFSVQS